MGKNRQLLILFNSDNYEGLILFMNVLYKGTWQYERYLSWR